MKQTSLVHTFLDLVNQFEQRKNTFSSADESHSTHFINELLNFEKYVTTDVWPYWISGAIWGLHFIKAYIAKNHCFKRNALDLSRIAFWKFAQWGNRMARILIDLILISKQNSKHYGIISLSVLLRKMWLYFTWKMFSKCTLQKFN